MLVLPLKAWGLSQMYVPEISGVSGVDALSKFLLQRTVQTQICYMHEFRDECKANWLSKFGDPAMPMDVEALSDREWRPVYSGLNGFCDDVTTVDYFENLVSSAEETILVSYEVGTTTPKSAASSASTSGAPDGFAESASAAWNMWEAANPGAASRRRNPYLKNQPKRKVEYEETIRPTFLARQLMSTRDALAKEFELDLGALLRQSIAEDDQLHIRDDGDSSPLRYENVALCERLATREAAIQVGNKHPAVARFIYEMIQNPPMFDDLQRQRDERHSKMDPFLADLKAAACNIGHKDALGDHTRERDVAKKWLDDIAQIPNYVDNRIRVKPANVAKSIRRIRTSVYEAWADELIHVVQHEHRNVDRLLVQQQHPETSSDFLPLDLVDDDDLVDSL